MGMLKGIVLGFIAGILAYVTFHEIVNAIFNHEALWTGWERPSWDMAPNAQGVPYLASGALVGGAWGALFPLLFGSLPRGPLTFKGLIYGLVGPALIGAMIIYPLAMQYSPQNAGFTQGLFLDGQASQIVPTLAKYAAFGASLGWLYGFFAYKRLPGFG